MTTDATTRLTTTYYAERPDFECGLGYYGKSAESQRLRAEAFRHRYEKVNRRHEIGAILIACCHQICTN